MIQDSFPPSEIGLYAVGGLCSHQICSWICTAYIFTVLKLGKIEPTSGLNNEFSLKDPCLWYSQSSMNL